MAKSANNHMLDYSSAPDEHRVAPLVAGIISVILGGLQYLFFVAGGLAVLFAGHPTTNTNDVLLFTGIPIPFAALLGLFAVWRGSSPIAKALGAMGVGAAIIWVVVGLGWMK